jgi:hypothetical protein
MPKRSKEHTSLRDKASDASHRVIHPRTSKDETRKEEMKKPDSEKREQREAGVPKALEEIPLPPATEKFLHDLKPSRPQRSVARSTSPSPIPITSANLSALNYDDDPYDPQSSLSKYSQDTASVGTVDSDNEARKLLAVADSGPVPQTRSDGSSRHLGEVGPEEDQVRRAKKVLSQ